ncbi:TIGR04222 domain-containing membrane protein [Kitasatospora sp. NPDC088779]|uniref:TIGR04222 domain-containing membrane protein n=1 Tax=Kitasatospora sp. NPDC088779 TaxID=3154964 RepID=UPI00342DD8C7
MGAHLHLPRRLDPWNSTRPGQGPSRVRPFGTGSTNRRGHRGNGVPLQFRAERHPPTRGTRQAEQPALSTWSSSSLACYVCSSSISWWICRSSPLCPATIGLGWTATGVGVTARSGSSSAASVARYHAERGPLVRVDAVGTLGGIAVRALIALWRRGSRVGRPLGIAVPLCHPAGTAGEGRRVVGASGGPVGSVGVVCAMAALLGAGLLRWRPARGRTDGLTATAIAGVRGGSKAALVVAVVELHLAGVLDTDRRGRLRRVVHTHSGQDATPLHRAARTAFGRDLSWADAVTTPPVRRAREEIRTDLVHRGLRCSPARLATSSVLATATCATGTLATARGVWWTGLPMTVLPLMLLCAPARTLAGHRLLRELRRRHPLSGAAASGDTSSEPYGTGLLTALYGRRALRLLLPDFAAQAALLGRRGTRETVARTGSDYGPYEGAGDAASYSGDL